MASELAPSIPENPDIGETRIEHCTRCGKVVTVKHNNADAEEREYHFHFYASNVGAEGMVYAPILCSTCVGMDPKNLDVLAAETLKGLPPGKPVHKNFGLNALRAVQPDAAARAEAWAKLWGWTVLPGMVKAMPGQDAQQPAAAAETVKAEKPKVDGKCPGCGESVMEGRPHVHHATSSDIRCLKCSGLSMDEYEAMKARTDPKYMTEGKNHATWDRAEWPPKQGYVQAPFEVLSGRARRSTASVLAQPEPCTICGILTRTKDAMGRCSKCARLVDGKGAERSVRTSEKEDEPDV